MKKIIGLLIFALLLGIGANAQVQNKAFSNDTITADTTTYVSGKLVDEYTTTVVAFAFTKIDVTDSLSVAKMEGSMDGTNWIAQTGTGILANTSTDGTTVLYVTNPIYLYYRGFLACGTGDQVAITNARFIIKED